MLFGSDVMIALQQAQDGDDIDLGMAAYLEDPKATGIMFHSYISQCLINGIAARNNY